MESVKVIEAWQRYYNDIKADANLSPEEFSAKHAPEYHYNICAMLLLL